MEAVELALVAILIVQKANKAYKKNLLLQLFKLNYCYYFNLWSEMSKCLQAYFWTRDRPFFGTYPDGIFVSKNRSRRV